MKEFRPKASATLLGAGIVILVIGQVLMTAGQQQAVLNSISGYGRDSGSIVLGVVVSVVGLAALVSGILNLARSIDYLAAREHARSVIAAADLDPDDLE